jgi:hypothetical protein
VEIVPAIDVVTLDVGAYTGESGRLVDRLAGRANIDRQEIA